MYIIFSVYAKGTLCSCCREHVSFWCWWKKILSIW